MPPGKLQGWRLGHFGLKRSVRHVPQQELEEGLEKTQAFVKLLHDAGAGLLLGTDCGTTMIVPPVQPFSR